MPALVVEANKQRIPLDQASITIGSGDKSMIQIQDPKLGPIHCQIVKTTAGFKVISIDQKVGTLINGVRVREQGLKGGDVIQIGDTRFIFQEDGVPRPTARIAGVPSQTAQPPPGTQRIAGIPPKPQTARIAGIPAAPAGAPRTTTSRIPQAPAQPVRPQTNRVPTAPAPRPTQAVRPPTGQIPARPTTSRVPPAPGTQGIPRPVTSRVQTQAAPAKAPSGRATAPAKPAKLSKKEARKGLRGSSRGIKALERARLDSRTTRISPVVYIIGFFALVAVGVVAYIVLIPDTEKVRTDFTKKCNKIIKEARELEADKKYDEAISKWRELLAEYNKLPDKLKTDYEGSMLSWKGDIKTLEDYKGQSSAEEKKVVRFIEDCQLQINNFVLDDARGFVLRNDWIKHAESTSAAKAKDLFAQLEKKVNEAGEQIKVWAKHVEKFNGLMTDKRYPDALNFATDFIAAAQEAAEKGHAERAKNNVLPAAREHLRVVRGNCRREKTANGKDAARKMFDEAVEKSFKGVVAQAELDKTWKEVEEFEPRPPPEDARTTVFISGDEAEFIPPIRYHVRRDCPRLKGEIFEVRLVNADQGKLIIVRAIDSNGLFYTVVRCSKCCD